MFSYCLDLATFQVWKGTLLHGNAAIMYKYQWTVSSGNGMKTTVRAPQCSGSLFEQANKAKIMPVWTMAIYLNNYCVTWLPF